MSLDESAKASPPKQIICYYSLHNQVSDNVSSAKYLGITVKDDLDWGQHCNNVTSKATTPLSFLSPKETKVAAYKALVRPHIDYATPIWYPQSRH